MTEKIQPVHVTAGVRSLVREYDDFLAVPSREQTRRSYYDVKNKYDVYLSMTKFDSEISSALTRISAVVSKAYDQPAMLDGGNETLLESVKKVMGEMDFDNILPNIVHDLSRDGDVVQVPAKLFKRATTTLKNLDGGIFPIPINILTIVDSSVKPGFLSTDVIKSRDKYLLNEVSSRPGLTDSQDYDSSIVWHISLNNRGNWSRDILNRNTFGIWGTSPLESLKNMVRWKYHSIRDDISWRHENVPRVDHSIDLDAVTDINMYSGTIEERISAATSAAQDIIDDYKASITNSDFDDDAMDVDQGLVHNSGVTIKQIGGNNTYADCLPIVKKVDMSIATRLGIPLSALGYESNSSYAIGKVTVTFMNTFGLQLLSAIQIGTFDFVKRVLMARGEVYDKAEWNKIYLNYNVTDFAELKELIEAWTTAYKHGVSRLGESRIGIGLNPIGKNEDKFDENNRFHPNLFQATPFKQGNNQNSLPLEEAQKKGDEGGNPTMYAGEPQMPIEQKIKYLEHRVKQLEALQDV